MNAPRFFKNGLLGAFAGFCRREIVPRYKDILFTDDFILAAALAVGIGWFGHRWLSGAPKSADLAVAFLAYAAIALGFCVGGMTIALTLPDRAFTEKLAKFEIDGKTGNALSGLLFVFTLTAVVHWIAICWLVGVLVFDGGDGRSFVTDPSITHRVMIGVTTFLCAYGLFRFLITVLTLAHVGRLYINQLRKP